MRKTPRRPGTKEVITWNYALGSSPVHSLKSHPDPVPSDLRRVAWDNPRLIERYRRLIRRLAPHLSRQVRYISIANEADVYFGLHPGQLAAFLRFARLEISELHRLVPWAKVGVTVTYRGLDLPQMVRIANGRPLVLQEAGYSSARRLGGTPAAQARFVGNVFTALRRARGAIPFLSFYTLYDLPASACPGHSDPVIFSCSLGLRRRDGEAKPAWYAYRAGATAVAQPIRPWPFWLVEPTI